jgi:hypothetical protein
VKSPEWPSHFRRLLCLILFLSAAFVPARGWNYSPEQSSPAFEPSSSLLPCASETFSARHGAFTLLGLTRHAKVAESLFTYTSALPVGSTVTFYLDGKPLRTETKAPFWLGGQYDGLPLGYSVRSLAKGDHQLYAVAKIPAGEIFTSSELRLHVVASINSRFSNELSVYPNQISSQTQTLTSLFERSFSPGANLGPIDTQTRCEVLSLYKNWGIDPTLDRENDGSAVLRELLPTHWSQPSPQNNTNGLNFHFSPDAPFYQEIPADWPRVALPTHYIQDVQLSTPCDGDGIGYGEVVAQSRDPQLIVRSQWYKNERTRKEFTYHMPSRWANYLPSQTNGDSHMIFVDPQTNSFVSAYKTSVDTETGGPKALFASSPTSLSSLGDHGGSNAAGIAELPLLVQPGEATDLSHPIRHAIGGAVGRTWAARVYPATAWDANIRTGENPCINGGVMNTGLVPYGAVIQLDPELDIGKLNLSLPARRLLEAMQKYGYYVMDFGCADLDIYTAVPASEFDPYGGLWGYNGKGPGVQVEVNKAIAEHLLFVVAPLNKKQ